MLRFSTKIRLAVLGVFVLAALSAVFNFPQVLSDRLPNWFVKPFNLGLDLQGGTHLVYEADVTNIPTAERSDAIEGVRDVIERRVNSFGVAEPIIQVNKAGDKWRVIVELAGIQDTKQAMGKIGETPLFNFTNVVDDFEMGVTHVIRGQEHVSNTPRQILIGEAIGAPRLIYAHCSIILNEERAKLSKRDPLVLPALGYKEEGYLPEGILNFMSLLGWNPGTPEEIFTLKELVEAFSIERMQKQPAIFNVDKLHWVNKEHIKKLSGEEIEKNILAWLKPAYAGFRESILIKLIPVILERISKWSDVKNMAEKGELDFFFKQPEYDKSKLIYKNAALEKIVSNLGKAIVVLKNLDEKDFNKENIKTKLMDTADSLDSRGELLHPVRFALSGLDKSPDPFIIAEILGKNETISRLQKAI